LILPRFPHLTLLSRLLLAGFAGLLNYAVFPNVGLWVLVWVCLTPLLVVTYQERSGWRALCLGLLTGVVFFTGTCHWISNVLRAYGGLSELGAGLLFLLLALHLSLFYGIFSWTLACISRRCGLQALWIAPAIWVATEYLRAHVLTGFPWCLLGYGLIDAERLAQVATVTGVYGLSFLAMSMNASLAALLLAPSKRTLFQLGALILALSGLSWTLGLTRPELSEPPRQVRIVQANIDLEQSWAASSKAAVLDELARLSRAGESDQKIDANSWRLILWPETPTPFYFNHDQDFRHKVEQIAFSTGSYLLFGFVDFRSAQGGKERIPYNSVALLSPEAKTVSQYDKIHLVPFGEYVPYASLFFFVEKISTEAGNFSPGERVVVSPVGTSESLGTFICYEAVVPDLVRLFARDGAQVLVNVTNDAWFGESAAPFQHLAMARMRSVENRRYLLRAANNGISAVIDPFGKVVSSIPRNQRAALESVFQFRKELTLYTRWGDWLAWSCLAVSAGSLVWVGAWGRREEI